MDPLEHTDLGGGVRAVIVEVPSDDDDHPAPTFVLERLEHDCVDGDGLAVVAAWPVNAESHQATFHQGHLTVRPGLMCDLCGRHGEITDGAWVPLADEPGGEAEG